MPGQRRAIANLPHLTSHHLGSHGKAFRGEKVPIHSGQNLLSRKRSELRYPGSPCAGPVGDGCLQNLQTQLAAVQVDPQQVDRPWLLEVPQVEVGQPRGGGLGPNGRRPQGVYEILRRIRGPAGAQTRQRPDEDA
jgi:hypothetical protein